MPTNEIYKPGWQLGGIICTDPATPDVGAPVRFGTLTGVALTHEGEGGNPAGQCTVNFGPAMWDLSVKDEVGGGVAAGDPVFYKDATAYLTNDPSGTYLFGIAFEVVGVGATATINVLHVTGPGSGTLGAGVIATVDLAAGILSADANGRAKMASNYFNNPTTVDAKFTAGSIGEDRLAAKELTGRVVGELADAATTGGIPVLHRIDVADASANTDVVLATGYKVRVVDTWLRSSGIAAHATDDHVKLVNGTGADDITNEIVKTATVNSVIHASTIDPAHEEIAAGGTLRVTAVKSTNVACTVYVLAVRVA